MNRYIRINNEKKRDAEITFKSINQKSEVKMVLPSGEAVTNKKVIKKTTNNIDKINADLLINSDPELDLELTGKFIESVSKIYINKKHQPVFRITKKEKIFSPTGEVLEERIPENRKKNISGESIVNWTGKLIPKLKIFNKLVFNKKYQLNHINGLTYDFLFEMAQTLDKENALMMLGAGDGGKDPLILNDGGKPYRAFLEGRIQEKKYCLILHLTDQELKPLPNI